MTLQELRDQKGNLAAQADEVLSLALKDNRFDLRADEQEKFDKIHAEIDKVNAFISRLEKQEALNAGEGRRTEPVQPKAERRTESRIVRAGSDALEALRSWALPGSKRTPEMREAAVRAGFNLDSPELTFKLPEQALRSLTPEGIADWEKRTALGTTSGAVGQYTVPDEMIRELEVSLLAFGGMRQVATIVRTNSGAALPWPTFNDTSNVGAILSENTEATEGSMTFGQLVLDSFKYSSNYILVSVELLQDSAVNVAQVVGRALGERIARITNTHFTTGDGSSKPRGIVTAAGTGKTGASGQTTSVIYDDLVDLEHSVDPAYRRNARFMFADSTLKALKKIKIPQYNGDTAGAPLWQPGLVQGQPDTILGYPYVINQDVAAMTASAKSIVFGDLSKYLIRDVRDIALLRLDERFATFHQVAFLAFSRHDGDLLDAGTDPVKLYVNAAS